MHGDKRDEPFRKMKRGEVAEALNVRAETLSKWANDSGCPMHAWEPFYNWVFQHKRKAANVINGLRNLKRRLEYEEDKKKEKIAKIQNPEDLDKDADRLAKKELKKGAVYALERLEQLETDQFEAIGRAKEAGDIVAEQINNDMYLKTIGALRQIQAVIWKEKKEAEEVLDKGEVIKVMAIIFVSMGFAEERFLDLFSLEASALSDENEIRQMGKGKFYEAVEASLNQAAKDKKLPAWVFEAWEKVL